MKSTIFKQSILAIALLGLVSSFASARPFGENAPLFSEIKLGDLVQISEGTYGTAFNGARGGEFTIRFLDNGSSWDFISFCLEYEVEIAYDTTYIVQTVVGDVVYGGGNGSTPGAGDPLSPQTKWVFWNYLQGSFDGYFGINANALANAVQFTIWYLEEEIDYRFNGSNWNAFYQDKVNGVNDYSIQGQVGVLNLVDQSGNLVQSQLISQPVPEPATMMLFGVGLAGLAGMVRSRKNP